MAKALDSCTINMLPYLLIIERSTYRFLVININTDNKPTK